MCLMLVATAAAPGSTAAHGTPVFVAAEAFTLAWTHSIEKQRWEEDYLVLPGATREAPPRLRASAARVRGSAAGMEPPEGARLVGGWYTYTPAITHPEELRLTRSEFTPDFELCLRGVCHPMGHWLASDGGVTRLTACSR
ncbi:MAG: DUF1850 domain-containing protein [Rubrivivax sp.]|nr:DUF1850 domain-containing protein [Rubrivivax sp.]